jgi:hypothetical protein
MRRARVSGLFASDTQCRSCIRREGLRPRNAASAPAPARPARTSAAGLGCAAELYAAAHLPFAFASRIRARPASCIRPSATSLRAAVRFAADQMLRGLRGANHSSKKSASCVRAWESIQPQQRASSSASR